MMEDDDEDVPQLITLDDHLSEQLDGKLKGTFRDEVAPRSIDTDSKKVPITILTGSFSSAAHSDVKGTWVQGRQLY